MMTRLARIPLLCVVLAACTPTTLTAAMRPQGDPPAPPDKVSGFCAAVREILRFGAAAIPVLGTVGKTESSSTAALLNAVGQLLKDKAGTEGVDTAPASVEPKAKALATAARELLALKDRALEPLAGASADAANADVKEYLAKAESRVYAALCTSAIRSYLGPSGSASGTFDGMFASLDKYDKEKIGDAFLDLFQSPTQAAGVRDLAGEGLAQIGGARHQAAVKRILDNQNESQKLKMRAIYTLARLGDRAPLDAILDNLATQMEKFKKPDMTPLETLQWASGYYQSATLSQNAHDIPAAIKHYESFLGAVEPVRDKLGEQLPKDTLQNIHYNLACLYSLKGDVDGGFKHLENAFGVGYSNFKWANTDGDLANLRKDPRFKALLEKWESGKGGKSEGGPESKPS